jgi:methanogenic corrinoid protein MtbC1
MNTQPLTKSDVNSRQQTASADIRRDILSRVVEAEIIPRLLMVHKAAEPPAPPVRLQLSPAEIAAFGELLLADNVPAINNYVDSCRARGMSVETVFLGLLTETARHLGELWGKDTCNFCEVTLATWRLQQLLHELSPAFQREGRAHRETGRRVLLSTVAAEQHTLGLSMVAEFFRRSGWEVLGEIPVSNGELIDMVAEQWLDLIGLSVSSEVDLDELTATIAGIRRMSCNPNIGVMVGGWLFLENQAIVATVGADFTACDGREAVARAEERARKLMQVASRHSRI